MPTMTPSQYANASRCYDCEIPPGAQLSVIIYLLAQSYLASNPMADISPSALANAARCYDCEIPPGAQLSVALYLLANGGSGGGGGGPGGGCLPGIWRAAPTNPEPPPAYPACDGQYLRFLDSSPSLYWNTALNRWI